MYSLTKKMTYKPSLLFLGQTYLFTIVHCIGPGKMSKEQRVVKIIVM